jgi:hypothetical protein
MSIAIAVIAVIGLTALGHLAWGAILVGREYDAEEKA